MQPESQVCGVEARCRATRLVRDDSVCDVHRVRAVVAHARETARSIFEIFGREQSLFLFIADIVAIVQADYAKPCGILGRSTTVKMCR